MAVLLVPWVERLLLRRESYQRFNTDIVKHCTTGDTTPIEKVANLLRIAHGMLHWKDEGHPKAPL
jgi:hypothetical protein